MKTALSNQEAPKGEIFKALFEVQGKLDHRIGKDSEADTGKYTYEYVSIEQVVDIVKPLCQAAGVLIVQSHTHTYDGISDGVGAVNIKTTLVHVESAQQVSGTLTLPFSVDTSNPSQEAGKAITYGRRYSLVSMFGLTPVGEDNDANESGTTVFSRDRAPAKKSYAGKSAKPAAKGKTTSGSKAGAASAGTKKGGLLGKKKSDDTPAEKKTGGLLGKKKTTSKSKAKRPTKKKDDAVSKFPKPDGEEDGAFNG